MHGPRRRAAPPRRLPVPGSLRLPLPRRRPRGLIPIPWYKVDDGLHSHPKARRAGLAALGMWTVAGSWSAQHVQEGFVPDWFVASWPNGRKRAAELVDAGLWQTGERDGEQGWWFHDWEHFQPSKAEIERDREHNRERQKRFREKRREARLRAVGDDRD